MKERHKVIPAAYVLLIRDVSTLLLRRFQTGYFDGYYSLPAGHVEEGETPTSCIIREAHEEVGITLGEEKLHLAHTLYRVQGMPPPYGRVDFFFTAETWESEPENREPEKCDDLRWFSLGDLPDNMVPEVKQAIEHFQRGVSYSEIR